MKSILAPFVLLAALACAGCSSTVLSIDTGPIEPDEEELGPATGSSQGLMILTAIPVGQNERFNAAYQAALSASGATRLIDIQIKESWWSTFFVIGYTYEVTGTAVRKRD